MPEFVDRNNTVFKFKFSEKLLERCVYYAVNTAWSNNDLFEVAQADAKALLDLKSRLETLGIEVDE